MKASGPSPEFSLTGREKNTDFGSGVSPGSAPMQQGNGHAMLRSMLRESPSLYWQLPRLRAERRWLAGVAAAIATEIGLDPLLIRLAFVLLTLANGVGLALYAASWLWFTYAAAGTHRAGRGAYVAVPKAKTPTRRAIGVSCIVLGVVLLARQALPSGLEDATLWPVAIAAFGLLLAWSSGKVDWSQPRELARAAGGLCLIAAGVISFIALNFARTAAPRALLLATGVLSLVVVIVTPWLWRAASQVGEARLERIRAEERAEMAAHLHDSVLQTLSLITRSADDPTATRQLARRQERELRQWLFGQGDRGNSGDTFRAALERVAAAVEDLHGVPIETVIVGDCLVDEAITATVAATREALINAAVHSGATTIDLYGELESGKLEVYVRDKGGGFEMTTVASDRRGVAESIVGRMKRIGGKATVTSQPGQGTEVVLELPRTALAAAADGGGLA